LKIKNLSSLIVTAIARTFAILLTFTFAVFGQVSLDKSINSNLTAQTGTFVMTSAASGVAATSSGAAFGLNAQTASYAVAPYTFPATSSGAVSVPNCNPLDMADAADCVANGLLIAAFDGASTFKTFLTPSYVSTTQINALLAQSSALRTGQSLQIAVFTAPPVNGQYPLSANWNRSLDLVDGENAQLYLTYTSLGGVSGAYLTGTLYGYTVDGFGNITGAVALKSLTDGTVNPSTYNGLPTIAQVYLSGAIQSPVLPLAGPYLDVKWELDGATGPLTYTVITPYLTGPGVFVTNVIPGPNQSNSWGGAGHHQVKIGYGNAIIFTQDNPVTGLIWMN
jgi:hypothetical protein